MRLSTTGLQLGQTSAFSICTRLSDVNCPPQLEHRSGAAVGGAAGLFPGVAGIGGSISRGTCESGIQFGSFSCHTSVLGWMVPLATKSANCASVNGPAC